MLILAPHITHKFNGDIWRLDIDEITSTLVLEIRNEKDKMVSFAAVSLPNGLLNFEGYTTPVRWLTGMETAFDGVLLLHHYQSASGPAHKGIIALNVATAGVLWSNYSLAFDHLTINGPVAYNTQMLPKKLSLLNIKTGEVMRPFNAADDGELLKNIKVPRMLSPSQYHGELPTQPYGSMIHYYEHNNFRIVSLHTQDAGVLNQRLYIIKGEDVIYEDLLNAGIQKLQPEAFVLHKNWLICLKNKNELLVFSL
ncbi:hypothetical protein DJ568_03360 [Mucilaginibacter hurinus]|uniref:DUF4905 domain-containing protein n=1 Tax=Mucilaginibacter hurinus TaxID=2201324 RepID=A0A367GQR8_9SPHI|nr:DUF4905 domain-containing protein [Mucilaginibacter hurinus]RCH55807.1 hypothetical protein DJ568_03360 [Mucilaginibacter hurinus]